MKILIIESTSKTKPLCENYADTSIIHCRNSLILKNELNADLCDGEYAFHKLKENKYDVIICCYASPYMPHKLYRRFIDNNPDARLVWLVNDHDLEDNQLLRYAVTEKNKKYDMICNNPRSGYRHWILGKNIAGKKLNDFIDQWHTCNLNCLIFKNDIEVNQDLIENEKQRIIYYGTYRKHRSEDFKKYLHSGLTVSTSSKHWKKLHELGCTAKCMNTLSWEIGKESLRNFKYSLYIEDKHTHDNFAFMANRFYEAIMCGVGCLFAPNTIQTIIKSKYNLCDQSILPENLFNQELNEYIDSLNHQRIIESQLKLHDTILEEKRETVAGIKLFLNK